MLGWIGSLVVWAFATLTSVVGSVVIEQHLKPISIGKKPDGRTATTLSETITLIKKHNGDHKEYPWDSVKIATGLLGAGLFLGLFPWHSKFRKAVGLALNLITWGYVWGVRDKDQWDQFRLF